MRLTTCCIDSTSHLPLAPRLVAVRDVAARRAQPQFGNPSPDRGQQDLAAGERRPPTRPLYQPVDVREREQERARAGRDPRRDQEQQRDVHLRRSRRTTSPTSPRSSSPAPTSRCSSAPTSGPLLREFELAYNLGDPQQARKFLGMGKLKTTKYVVKFDILKAEQIASAQQGFDGRAIGDMAALAGAFSRSWGGAQAGAVAGRGIGSVQSNEATTVWLVGMRYKIINAETTEQVATGYTEEKMEIGATRQAALGVSQSQRGASASTRWCSDSCRSRCGRSTASTSSRGPLKERGRRLRGRRRRFRARRGDARMPSNDRLGKYEIRGDARARRDGRRLRGVRPDDQAPSSRSRRSARDQLAGDDVAERARALPPRGAGGGTPRPPEHRRDLRVRRGRAARRTSRWSTSRAASSRLLRRQRATSPRRHRAAHDADPRRARLLAPPASSTATSSRPTSSCSRTAP